MSKDYLQNSYAQNSSSGFRNRLRIVFMGTPEFAVASLDALLREGYDIAGVITAPDKPSGRGMQFQQSPVKKYALECGLPVLQPEKLKNPEFLSELKLLGADLQVVVAFRMLPEVVWNMPLMGTVNVHGSLLPQYRGAAPINWAIINGEKTTGVTTFRLQQEIDTGHILLQQSMPIGEDETAGELHDRMKEIGAQLLVQTLKGLSDGTLREKPQGQILNDQLATQKSLELSAYTPLHSTQSPLRHAPKIFTGTCKIDWNKTVNEVHNLVRGLSPYPAAFTFLNGRMLKIFRGEKELAVHSLTPGEFNTDKKTFLKFAASDGFINVKELQAEGKKRMYVEDFLRGYQG